MIFLSIAFLVFTLLASAAPWQTQAALPNSLEGTQSLTETSILQTLSALHDERQERLASSTQAFLTLSAGLSAATFSWRDRRRAANLGLNLYFPPLQSDTWTQKPIERIASAIQERSTGVLRVDPHVLGYVDGYSAAVFDQVLFRVAQLSNGVAEFKPTSLEAPPAIRSLVRYQSGPVRFVLAYGSFSRPDRNVTEFAFHVIHNKSLHWKATSVTRALQFDGAAQTVEFPANLAWTDENGRLDNRIFEMARFTAGKSLSFASVAQLNYYSPGCCWDYLPTPQPTVDALLLVYNSANSLTIYVGYGHATDT